MAASVSSRIAWPRLGAEAVIIIASILLALGVDEWREEKRDRELESEYLVRLLEDLDANIAILNQQRQSGTSQIANARAIYPLVTSGSMQGIDNTIAITASYNASPSATPNWVDDTFEELKTTGRLGLIRDPDIRRNLLAYYRFLEAQDWAYQLMSREYRDAIRARMDPDLQLLIRQQCQPRNVGCRVETDAAEAATYVDWLANNQSLADGLRRVIVQWSRGENEYLPRVETRTDELKQQIEEELRK
jgi:type II secretory pathway pseudopilin PulG